MDEEIKVKMEENRKCKYYMRAVLLDGQDRGEDRKLKLLRNRKEEDGLVYYCPLSLKKKMTVFIRTEDLSITIYSTHKGDC